MIDVFKTILAGWPDFGWRPLIAATPLFLVSDRVLAEAALGRPISSGSLALAHRPTAEPRTAGTQWRQIARGIEDRVQGARKAAELQTAALVQIDAADFTLASIVADLAAVMPRAAELRVRAPRPVLVALAA
jgi:hypothetical protein